MTLNGGIIADLFVPEERGAANALSAIGVIFGPVLGPLLGAFIGQKAGWRWIYWVL
jgi:MFS family permease